jgi:hypothetical protein
MFYNRLICLVIYTDGELQVGCKLILDATRTSRSKGETIQKHKEK